MKHLFFLFLTLLCFFKTSYAQDFYYLNKSSKENSSKNYLLIHGNTDNYSNGLNINLLNLINTGGELNSADLNKDISALKNLNRFESTSNYGLFLQLTPIKWLKDRKYDLFFNVAQKNIIAGRFTKNLAQVLAYGNEPFLGQNLNFDNSKIFNVNYQEIGIGASKLFEVKEFIINTSLGINYLNAKNGNDIFIETGGLYTDSNAIYVKGNLDGSFQKFPSSSKPGKYFVNKGNGISMDFNFSISKPEKWTLSGGINNLGKIKIYQSAKVSIDTNFLFNGIYIDTYKILYDTLYQVSGDSISNLLKFREYGSSKVVLPFFAYLKYSKGIFANKFSVFAGISYRNNFLKFPTAQIGLSYNRYKIIPRGDLVLFGGNKLSYKLGASYPISEFLKLDVQTLAPHFIFYRNSNSFGAAVCIRYYFN